MRRRDWRPGLLPWHGAQAANETLLGLLARWMPKQAQLESSPPAATLTTRWLCSPQVWRQGRLGHRGPAAAPTGRAGHGEWQGWVPGRGPLLLTAALSACCLFAPPLFCPIDTLFAAFYSLTPLPPYHAQPCPTLPNPAPPLQCLWPTLTTTASSCWTPPPAPSPRWRAPAARAVPTAAAAGRSCRSRAGCARGQTVSHGQLCPAAPTSDGTLCWSLLADPRQAFAAD